MHLLRFHPTPIAITGKILEPRGNTHAVNSLWWGENSLEGAISSTHFPCIPTTCAMDLAQVACCRAGSHAFPEAKTPQKHVGNCNCSGWPQSLEATGNGAPNLAFGGGLPAISRAQGATPGCNRPCTANCEGRKWLQGWVQGEKVPAEMGARGASGWHGGTSLQGCVQRD